MPLATRKTVNETRNKLEEFYNLWKSRDQKIETEKSAREKNHMMPDDVSLDAQEKYDDARSEDGYVSAKDFGNKMMDAFFEKQKRTEELASEDKRYANVKEHNRVAILKEYSKIYQSHAEREKPGRFNLIGRFQRWRERRVLETYKEKFIKEAEIPGDDFVRAERTVDFIVQYPWDEVQKKYPDSTFEEYQNELKEYANKPFEKKTEQKEAVTEHESKRADALIPSAPEPEKATGIRTSAGEINLEDAIGDMNKNDISGFVDDDDLENDMANEGPEEENSL